MMKLTFLALALIALFSSCDKLEMIPVKDLSSNTISDNTFYTFNADEKFAEVPPAKITVNKSTNQASRSYIERSVKTSYIKYSDISMERRSIKLLKWLGLVCCIVLSLIGMNSLAPETIKQNKIWGPVKIVLFQVPMVLFFIFIDYPALFLFLWFLLILFIPVTIAVFTDLFKVSFFTFILLCFFGLFIWTLTGFKAGSRVYIDNASTKNTVLIIKDKKVAELPSTYFTKIRISAQNPTIEVISDGTTIEKYTVPLHSGIADLIKHALFPWRKYVFNIYHANTYYISHVSYF